LATFRSIFTHIHFFITYILPTYINKGTLHISVVESSGLSYTTGCLWSPHQILLDHSVNKTTDCKIVLQEVEEKKLYNVAFDTLFHTRHTQL